MAEPEDRPGQNDSEDDYRESEDEDFNPSAPRAAVTGESDGSADSDEDSGDDDPIPSYKAIEGEGFVQTRSQRLKQDTQKEFKQAESSSLDIDALWKEFNQDQATKPAQHAAAATEAHSTPQSNVRIPRRDLEDEKITIERTFKFAGKVTTETKTVLKSSAEGKAYIQSQQEKKEAHQGGGEQNDSPLGQKPLKRKPGPVKRRSTLMEEYQANKAKKINTLQKSKLDWLGFVDKEGINDDLKKHNKDGFLEKQDFLARVDNKMDEDIRAHRRNDKSKGMLG